MFEAAFPKDGKGNIVIALHHAYDNNIELMVSDDGVGIPEEMDIRDSKSMGLRLIVMLAENQLEGKITLDRTNGTTYKILFERQKYKSRIGYNEKNTNSDC